MNNEIFVFGSNESGRHGAGAAKIALEKYGAVYGCGFGHFGNSFAIPTKNHKLETLPLNIIQEYVDAFILYARGIYFTNFSMKFKVTRIGCGLAGYKDEHIAPLFKMASLNCMFDEKWKPHLKTGLIIHDFWGTF
jgi:hypothetical protein